MTSARSGGDDGGGKGDNLSLQQMKRDGRKIVGVVVYDYQMAQIVDRAGVDIVSVGDSVGINLWGQRQRARSHARPDDPGLPGGATGSQACARQLRFPVRTAAGRYPTAVAAAIRLVKEGGADVVKLDGASAFPDGVRASTSAGIPVWAQFGITPHTAMRYGGLAEAGPELPAEIKDQLVEEARALQARRSGPSRFHQLRPRGGTGGRSGVSIPVIGGLGGGPWLDGRVRAAFAALGYLAGAIDDARTERYAMSRREPHSTGSPASLTMSARGGRFAAPALAP